MALSPLQRAVPAQPANHYIFGAAQNAGPTLATEPPNHLNTRNKYDEKPRPN
jgi:hypothetical protein